MEKVMSEEKNLSLPYHTSAWLLSGVNAQDHGVLEFDGSRLIYTTTDKKNNFNISIQELRELKYPWYYFGGGFKATIVDRKVSISLIVPNYQVDPLELDENEFVTPAWQNFGNIFKGRKKMKIWRSIFLAYTSK